MAKFLDVADKIDVLEKQIRRCLETMRLFCEKGYREGVYEQAMRLEEAAERMVLLARVLPVYTGVPAARPEVRQLMEVSIPVEIGFTAEGWFSLRLPALLPKKGGGSADYIRSFLYPAMEQFFKGRPPVRYEDCVLIYRHVYDRERPERRMRDHDNIEINMVSDIVAMYVMPDDGPAICSHYYCSAEGPEDRTEVYVAPKQDFPAWLILEQSMPDEGVELYEKR